MFSVENTEGFSESEISLMNRAVSLLVSIENLDIVFGDHEKNAEKIKDIHDKVSNNYFEGCSLIDLLGLTLVRNPQKVSDYSASTDIGESFDHIWYACGKDANGNTYALHWMFTEQRGYERDLKDFDWDAGLRSISPNQP